MKSFFFLCAAALLGLGVAHGAAEDLQFDTNAVLSENELGRAGTEDMTQAGRWGNPEKEGARTYRLRSGALSRVGIKAWWPQGEFAPEDVLLAITVKDTVAEPVTVAGWNGTGSEYGYESCGYVGGRKDGQWRTYYLRCVKECIRRHAADEWKGNWSLLFDEGAPAASTISS